ncbi:o-succinylbenzoate--CoA ligase [uncultured Vibrio sp.]|uniref:o-succinylbenzoate--CoA ligase n=1 Tax=uncultured Vibrio sp. TaxID=114054 RepID=UPI000ACF4E09|nr:o-succinylbenzoate--CoA ligase [uncultured Vibrio sp.]
MLTIQSSIRHWAQRSPFSCALITPEKNYSWVDLQQQVNQMTHHFMSQGVGKGDVVTLVGKNQPEMLFAYLACCELGAIAALTMPQPYTNLTLKLSMLYHESQPRYLWCSRDVWLSFSEQERADIEDRNQRLNVDSPAENTRLEALEERKPSELASIVFTSGSTGQPKAVAHSFEQHFASAFGLLSVFDFGIKDTWLLSLPMYHVSGLAIVYRWLAAGGCLKVGTGDLKRDIQEVTHASLVATQLRQLIDSQQPLALSRVLLGGSHIPSELGKMCAAKGIDTWLGYGMTEAASTVTAKPIDDIVSAGQVLPNRLLKIQNNRIFIGGKTLANGYFFQGKVTPLVDDTGWFDSKDLGHWVNDELKVIGRADNQFISGGENVHCEEIEEQLNRHPLIMQSFVVPIEDDLFGHRPVAVIESTNLVGGEEQRQEFGHSMKIELDEYLKSRLEKFKWPIRYYQMPSDLKGTGIKVSRKELKQWLVNKIKMSG